MFGVDDLLADFRAYLLLLGDDLGVHAEAFVGHDLFLGVHLLAVQHHDHLFLGQFTIPQGLAVGVGKVVAFDVDLLEAYRYRLVDLISHDVLTQPDPPNLPLLNPDPDPLLGAEHPQIPSRCLKLFTIS